ncbi:F-type H+-transporting ATPase subunit gamma [Bacilli bacterium PM5-3]|nr:F-type H+-transporting ATPase subunit gamma [Bacilli bacterium PM5-3]MDH6603990.1 F-type H+-transporting ATPase subunit gamma [Bacilli bacterium PM5-9]
MASLQNTKRRIKSVDSTKKITKAMELVSSAKLRKAKQSYEEGVNVRDFVCNDLASAVYEIAKEANLNKYIEEDPNGKTLFIVIASDMGLCGGYNANVAKEAFNASKKGDYFICVGKKTQPFFLTKGCTIKNVYQNITKNPEFYDAYYITKEALDMFKNEEISAIKLVYTKFINSVSFEPKIYSLIPVENPYDDMKTPFDNPTDAEYLIKYLMRDFINSNIYTAIIESRVCEYASSRIAMENATDNANEIKEKLLLQYNRARQANITQEITEIVGGADAI